MIIDKVVTFEDLNKEAETEEILKKQQKQLNGMKILLKQKERDYERHISQNGF